MTFKNLSLIASSIIMVSINLLGAEELKINLQEVVSYSAQKHRVDFQAQTEKSKSDILNEYSQAIKLADALSNAMKDDVDLKVAIKLATIEIWAQKFMANINPSDDGLKKIYEAQSPRIAARYNLRNILVKDDITADKLLKTLNSIKDKDKKLEKFKELVKTESIDLSTKANEGAIGFIDANKLDKNLQEILKNKNSGDIVKANIPILGIQILFIEEYQAQRVASFDESKQVLISVARQETLKAQINSLLQNK